MRYLTAGLLLGILMLGGTSFAQETGKPFLNIGTGGINGVYYAAGHAIDKVFSASPNGFGFRLDPEASLGSVDNINKVLAGEWEFGIAQANILYKAETGKGDWEGQPQTELRAVAALFTESLTLFAAEDANINTVNDLRGKTVSVGPAGSGGEEDALAVLAFNNINPQTDLTITHDLPIDAPGQLQAGFIDAFFITVAHPNLASREATFGDRKVKLVASDSEDVAEKVRENPILQSTSIPVDFYPALSNKQPVPSIGIKAVLFTRKSTPDEYVTAVLQALIDHFELFERQHPAFIKLSPTDLDKGTVIPLHPAAEAIYLKEGLR